MARGRLPIVIALLAGVVALWAAPAGALAQGRWMPPVELTSSNGVNPQVAISDSGDGIAVWGARVEDAKDEPAGPVSFAVRPPGGQFGPARAATAEPVVYRGMVANEAGDASVLFQAPGGPGQVARPALGDFGVPVALQPRPRAQAIDGFGNTTIVSEVADAERGQSLVATTRSAHGELGVPRVVARSRYFYPVSVATDRVGNVTVAWRGPGRDDARGSQLFVATAPPNGEFSQPKELTEPMVGDEGAEVLMNARGDTLVAWFGKRSEPHMRDYLLHSSFRPAGGEFGPVEEVADPHPYRSYIELPDLAMSSTGDVIAAWTVPSSVVHSYRPAGGTWEAARFAASPPVCCADPDFESLHSPTVAFDGKGTATLAYVSSEIQRDATGRYRATTGPRLVAVRRARGGDFGEREVVAAERQIVDLDSAADLLGNTIVVWSRQVQNVSSPSLPETGIGSVVWDASRPSVTRFGVDAAAELPSGEEGPAFRFKLTEAATVAVTIRPAKGGARLAEVRFRSKRGSGTRPIGKKLARKLRAAGRYRATVVARDSAGRSSKPRVASFGRLGR